MNFKSKKGKLMILDTIFFTIFFKRFTCQISRINTFTNDDSTRTFIAFEIDKSQCGLYHELIKGVNKCLKLFKFPTYYKVF